MLGVSGCCMSSTFMYRQNWISLAICDNKVGFPKYSRGAFHCLCGLLLHGLIAKLILMAGLVYPGSCASIGHLYTNGMALLCVCV